MTADPSYQPLVYREQGGARQVVASGGSLDVESGGEIDIESGGSLKFAGSTILGSDSRLTIGAFHSTTKGYGLTVNPAYTAAARVYADDNGAALTPSGAVPDLRAILGRYLVTANQSAIHARVWGVMGQAKVYDALWNEEQLGGVNGRLEVVQSAGTTTLAGYGISAGVQGIFATAGTVLVNTNHVVAGVAAIADIKGTVTQTGIVAGVYVGKYDTTNWSDATSRADWSYGVYVASGTTGIYVGTGPTTAIDARGLVTVAQTITSATPATTRLIRSELTVTPATSAAVGSNGSLAGVRGCVTLTTGKSLTDGYLFGVQGKLVLDGATINVGSDHIAAVYGQLSMSGSTLTAGHVSAIHADIQSTPTSALVNGVYVESATGNVINSFFSAFGKSTYVFDLASNTHDQMSTTGTAGATAAKGWLKVFVEGAVRYIPLTDSVS